MVLLIVIFFWMKGFLLMLQDGEGTWSQLNLLGGETLSGFQMQWAKKLGNGTRIKFWCDRRLGLECLKNVFPRLYQVATQKDATVSQMGSWCGGHYKKFGY